MYNLFRYQLYPYLPYGKFSMPWLNYNFDTLYQFNQGNLITKSSMRHSFRTIGMSITLNYDRMYKVHAYTLYIYKVISFSGWLHIYCCLQSVPLRWYHVISIIIWLYIYNLGKAPRSSNMYASVTTFSIAYDCLLKHIFHKHEINKCLFK